MTQESDKPKRNPDAQKKELDKRLDAVGWGLFLIRTT